MKTVYLNAAYFPAVELLSALATVGILLYGGYQAIEGEVTVGVLVAFIAALNDFFDPIQQLSQLYTTYQAGMAALDKIFELLDEEPDLVDAPDAIELPRAARRDRASTTSSFRYGEGDDAAGRCATSTSHVPPGQTVALVGATGAGKSTFAKLVARFYDPTDGPRARRRPRPARRRGPRRCARRWASCPQEAFLFSGTIGENIAFGRAGRDATRRSSRGRRAPSARDEFIDGARPTATTPRSASAARSSRPASASSSRSPAR